MVVKPGEGQPGKHNVCVRVWVYMYVRVCVFVRACEQLSIQGKQNMTMRDQDWIYE